ncbi:osmotically inducible lipoprotein OsmB [Ramlibacter sp. AW1]|uniref:Osmotically inducible lipoprotein OsmB n=1 Tax=Ramlibacter aurantiacus TaxID=2801330 RepID=A0A937D380_9BURK|nr:osmotically inducible lipoprotein OsmB [Ramlibacter aurantiacus]MBL0420455.1 osmotically inducible lipoprotein OsmB [Ramlibacter aurantiacus]
MKSKLIAALAAASLMGLAGCANMSPSERQLAGTAGGVAAGALAGGALTGGSTLGTLGGAAAGGYLGNQATNPNR